MMESALCLPVSKGSWKRNFPPSHPAFQITEVWLNRVSIHHRYNSHFIIPFFLFSTWYEHECKSIDLKVKRQRNINGLKWGSFQVISPPEPSKMSLHERFSQHSNTRKYDNHSKHNWKISEVELEAFFVSLLQVFRICKKKKFMKVLWQEDKLWNCKNREINGFWRLTNSKWREHTILEHKKR